MVIETVRFVMDLIILSSETLNYSRHLTGAQEGEPPPTLVDFFKKDFLLIIDESHMTVPQVGGMFRGDRPLKKVKKVPRTFRERCDI